MRSDAKDFRDLRVSALPIRERRRAKEPRLRRGPVLPYRYQKAWGKAKAALLAAAILAMTVLLAIVVAAPTRRADAPATEKPRQEVRKSPEGPPGPQSQAPQGPAAKTQPGPTEAVPDAFEAPPSIMRPEAMPPAAPAPEPAPDAAVQPEPPQESAKPPATARPRTARRPARERGADGTTPPRAPFTLPQSLRPTN